MGPQPPPRPVGDGKTSALDNCLERINSPAKNVMTIEDPIEHRIAGVNQCQVYWREIWVSAKDCERCSARIPMSSWIGEILTVTRNRPHRHLRRPHRCFGLQHVARLGCPQHDQQSL